MSYEAGADVLYLIGCMNLVEFLGGVHTGKIGVSGAAEKRFKQGVELLGERYSEKTLRNANIMWNLRNALVHQYIPEDKINNIGILNLWGKKFWSFADEHMIRPPHYKTGGKIPFATNIHTDFLLADLVKAKEKLIEEIKENEKLRNKLKLIFWWMPKITEQNYNELLSMNFGVQE
ncbi:hypothetical protein ACFLUY_00215 [Chloroflexota bacterium]